MPVPAFGSLHSLSASLFPPFATESLSRAGTAEAVELLMTVTARGSQWSPRGGRLRRIIGRGSRSTHLSRTTTIPFLEGPPSAGAAPACVRVLAQRHGSLLRPIQAGGTVLSSPALPERSATLIIAQTFRCAR